MIKTLKEFINDHIKIFREFMIKKANNEDIDNYVSDFGNILKEILQAHENEIAEKDEYIKFLENRRGNHNCKNCPNNKQQLFKEDFEKRFIDVGYFPRPLRYVLKDNSLYDKLPSKEEK